MKTTVIGVIILTATFIVILLFPPKPSADHSHHHGHDHHGHNHGHHHIAPHGGCLVVFGEEFAHIEFVMNKEGTLKAYILDSEAVKGIRLKQKEFQLKAQVGDQIHTLTFSAKANELTGETVGDTSEFETSNSALKGIKEFKATLPKISIRGVEFQNTAFPFPKGNEAHH